MEWATDLSNYILTGGFNQFEEYARQIGSSPQILGWQFPKYLKPPPVALSCGSCFERLAS